MIKKEGLKYAEGLVPSEYKDQYDKMKKLFSSDQQALKNEALKTAESYVPGNYLEKIKTAKDIYNDPNKIKG